MTDEFNGDLEDEILDDDITDDETPEDTPEDETDEDIAIYEERISALDAQLAEYRQTAINDAKVAAMKDAGYTDTQVGYYVNHIDSEDIVESINELREIIPPGAKRSYVDPNTNNWTKDRRPADGGQAKGEALGRSLMERLIHRIRL